MTQSAPLTIGVLYTGDLGSHVARMLTEQGHDVVTTCEGRSDDTRRRALESGARLLDTVADVVLASNVLLSIVLPGATTDVAERCGATLTQTPLAVSATKCFVDMNSIHPAMTQQIGDKMERAGFKFVDAAIHGTATELRKRGVLYLSGQKRQRIADLFSPSLRVVDLGDEVGTASAMKLLMSGMSKGLAALFMEVTRIAHDRLLLKSYLDEFTAFYPDISVVLNRLVTTYPRHADRRVSELDALASLAESFSPGMVSAASGHVNRLAQLRWPDDADTMSLGDVAEFAAQHGA